MLALLFTATLMGHPVLPVADDGEAIIRTLHARYGAVWHRTQTFVQKTTYPDGRVDTWYEAIELPGKLRIDVAPTSGGRTMMFRNDSIYQFGSGTLRAKSPYVHSMMVLLGDMFVEDPSRTISRLKALHFDLSKHYESTWEGRPTLVIGATAGDTISNQFWLDKERLVVVRMIEKMPDNRRFEAHFSGYQQHGASWVESRIAFFIDGKADQLEEYHDVRTRVTHEPGLFNPDSYVRATWAGERSQAVVSTALRTTVLTALTATSLWAQAPITPLVALPEPDAATLTARRARLLGMIGRRVAVMVGAPSLTRETPFAQDNNFRYLTGVTAPNAALVLDGRNGTTRLYLPVRNAMQRLWEDSEREPGAQAALATGVDSVFPRAQLEAHLRALIAAGDSVLVPFGPPEWSPSSALDAARAWNVTSRDPLIGWDHYHTTFRQKLAALQPAATMSDLTPLLFRVRWIKDQYEIAAMRRAASLAVVGLMEAIRSTAVGRTEAEIATAAEFASRLHGAPALAFPPVMATGRSVNVMHHQRLDRTVASGDLLLIDYGAMSNGYMSDITRTWPANGTFTAEQREIYESLAAAHAAILAAIRPGVRPSELIAIGQRVMRERGDTAGAWLITNNYLGHPVGMSTHDPWGEGTDAPWQAGVVYNIEPVVDLPQRGWHFRIEDTIVVTANGVEVLTRAAPTAENELVRLREETGIYERLVSPGAGGR